MYFTHTHTYYCCIPGNNTAEWTNYISIKTEPSKLVKTFLKRLHIQDWLFWITFQCKSHRFLLPAHHHPHCHKARLTVVTGLSLKPLNPCRNFWCTWIRNCHNLSISPWPQRQWRCISVSPRNTNRWDIISALQVMSDGILGNRTRGTRLESSGMPGGMVHVPIEWTARPPWNSNLWAETWTCRGEKGMRISVRNVCLQWEQGEEHPRLRRAGVRTARGWRLWNGQASGERWRRRPRWAEGLRGCAGIWVTLSETLSSPVLEHTRERPEPLSFQGHAARPAEHDSGQAGKQTGLESCSDGARDGGSDNVCLIFVCLGAFGMESQ